MLLPLACHVTMSDQQTNDVTAKEKETEDEAEGKRECHKRMRRTSRLMSATVGKEAGGRLKEVLAGNHRSKSALPSWKGSYVIASDSVRTE